MCFNNFGFLGAINDTNTTGDMQIHNLFYSKLQSRFVMCFNNFGFLGAISDTNITWGMQIHNLFYLNCNQDLLCVSTTLVFLGQSVIQISHGACRFITCFI